MRVLHTLQLIYTVFGQSESQWKIFPNLVQGIFHQLMKSYAFAIIVLVVNDNMGCIV